VRIIVLAGGLSPERDVSLSSGTLVANALIERGHDVLLLDLYLGVPHGGARFLTRTSTQRYSYSVPAAAPDLERLKRESGRGNVPLGPGVLELCQAAEVVFLALHGDIGENGQLQALFDIHGVRYTGSGYIGCLLAMDKDLSKKLLVAGGVSTAPWVTHVLGEPWPDLAGVGFPCVVKPLSCGSSVGISMVDNQAGLELALREAGRYEGTVLIEQKVEGREFSCGVLGGEALPVIEIIPHAGFYDYQNKYQPGLTEEICPAVLPLEVTHRIQRTALDVHRLLRLGFYSRTDFLWGQDDRLVCLEANTLPGLTPTSLLPQEAAAAGIPYGELCERIAFHGV